MTKLLAEALTAAAHNPPGATQDDIAHVLLRLAGRANKNALVSLSTDERAAIAASKAAAAHGEFATDEPVQATWSKRGL